MISLNPQVLPRGIEEVGAPRNAGIRWLFYHSVPIQNFDSFSHLPLKIIPYEFTPDFDLEPCHYQVHTFLIFTNVLDKDLICLNTKIQESMHLGMENIGNFLKPFFSMGSARLKNCTGKNVTRVPCWPWSALREIEWCSTRQHIGAHERQPLF